MKANKQSRTALTTAKAILPDELNPDYLFSLTHTELLLKIAKGEINAQALAKRELANRGIGTDGDWVGTETAEMKWELKTDCNYYVRNRLGKITYFATHEQMMAHIAQNPRFTSMGATKYLNL